MIKIFVLHYKKLVERKQFLLKQFEKHNITNFEFIETYDVNDGDITENELKLFESDVTHGMKSLILKHIRVYKEISQKYDYALILEDDVIFNENFTELLNNYITQLSVDYDMLFIGNGCNFHIPNNELITHCNVYKKCLEPSMWGGDGATRCTDSYLVSKKCAIELVDYISNINITNNKIFKASDWWLNKVCRDKQFNVYWAEPTIVSQGSQNGFYASSQW